jgi:flavin reductase
MVERDEFRRSMSRLGAAVNLITTDGQAGRCGFTASTVCSVSDDPPMLLVCMNRRSEQNAAFKANGVLCVNTLAAGQEHLSALFAGFTRCDMEKRFGQGVWSTASTGAPLLEEALVSFDCEIERVEEVATHSVFFCRVVAIRQGGSAEGLVYFDRAYHRVGGAAAAA